MNIANLKMESRESGLLIHFLKTWVAHSSPNRNFRSKFFSEAEDFIVENYGEEWMEYITDSDKFDELLQAEV